MCSHAEPEETGSRGMKLPCWIGCCPTFVFVVVIKKQQQQKTTLIKSKIWGTRFI